MGSSHQVGKRFGRSDRCFQSNSQRFSAGLGKKGGHGGWREPRDVAGEVERTCSHANQVLLKLFVVNVEGGWLKERATFEGPAEAEARDHGVDTNLREHHTEFAFEDFAFFQHDGALLNLDAAAHNLGGDTNGVQVTNNGTWGHTGVLLLHHDLVGRNVAFLGGSTGFGLLEFGEQLEGVER